MSIIRTEVSGYHHIGFYDTEFIIKGTLYIDTRMVGDAEANRELREEMESIARLDSAFLVGG